MIKEYLSHVMRKSASFCICKNKDADQLCGNCAADQCLCFGYIDTTITLLSKSEISSIQPSVAVSPVCVGPGRKPRGQIFSDAAHLWQFSIEADVLGAH